mmetsp:Transcript_3931/g.8411  ORF Transcript_3931/g.8411 Transcript_3931/m.8411 type:complete len:83 (+) Transcript_3931:345-593(+)
MLFQSLKYKNLNLLHASQLLHFTPCVVSHLRIFFYNSWSLSASQFMKRQLVSTSSSICTSTSLEENLPPFPSNSLKSIISPK